MSLAVAAFRAMQTVYVLERTERILVLCAGKGWLECAPVSCFGRVDKECVSVLGVGRGLTALWAVGAELL